MILKECFYFGHLYLGMHGCLKDLCKTVMDADLKCEKCKGYIHQNDYKKVAKTELLYLKKD